MAKIYINPEGNYFVSDGEKRFMLLDNGSSFEKIKIDFDIMEDDMVEIEDDVEKYEILKKAGLR